MLLWDEVQTALGSLSCSRGMHEIVLVLTKFPGKVNGSPYTITVDEACISSFGVVRISSKTHDNLYIQLGPVNLISRDVFIVIWKRLTNMLD